MQAPTPENLLQFECNKAIQVHGSGRFPQFAPVLSNPPKHSGMIIRLNRLHLSAQAYPFYYLASGVPHLDSSDTLIHHNLEVVIPIGTDDPPAHNPWLQIER